MQGVPAGSLVSVLVANGPIGRHWGVYLGDGWVASWNDESAIYRQPLSEFAVPGDLRVEAKPQNRAHGRAVLKRLKSPPRSRRYNLLSWNCEHFAKWCFYGRACSGQIVLAGGGAIVGGIAIYEKNPLVGLLACVTGVALLIWGFSPNEPVPT
jgi:hypothetical protein